MISFDCKNRFASFWNLIPSSYEDLKVKIAKLDQYLDIQHFLNIEGAQQEDWYTRMAVGYSQAVLHQSSGRNGLPFDGIERVHEKWENRFPGNPLNTPLALLSYTIGAAQFVLAESDTVLLAPFKEGWSGVGKSLGTAIFLAIDIALFRVLNKPQQIPGVPAVVMTANYLEKMLARKPVLVLGEGFASRFSNLPERPMIAPEALPPDLLPMRAPPSIEQIPSINPSPIKPSPKPPKPFLTLTPSEPSVLPILAMPSHYTLEDFQQAEQRIKLRIEIENVAQEAKRKGKNPDEAVEAYLQERGLSRDSLRNREDSSLSPVATGTDGDGPVIDPLTAFVSVNENTIREIHREFIRDMEEFPPTRKDLLEPPAATYLVFDRSGLLIGKFGKFHALVEAGHFDDGEVALTVYVDDFERRMFTDEDETPPLQGTEAQKTHIAAVIKFISAEFPAPLLLTPERPITIGRDPNNKLSTTHNSVSDVHATIQVRRSEQRGWEIVVFSNDEKNRALIKLHNILTLRCSPVPESFKFGWQLVIPDVFRITNRVRPEDLNVADYPAGFPPDVILEQQGKGDYILHTRQLPPSQE